MFTSSVIHKIYLKLYMGNANNVLWEKKYPMQDTKQQVMLTTARHAFVMHENNKISDLVLMKRYLSLTHGAVGFIKRQKITSATSFYCFVSKLASILPLACGEIGWGASVWSFQSPSEEDSKLA